MNQTKQTVPLKGAMMINLPGKNPKACARTPNDLLVIQNEDHKEFMKRPWLWPLETILPLKRRLSSTELEMGLLARSDVEKGLFRVYLGTTLCTSGTFIHYDTSESAAAAGWRVD